jgi:hypothetical protein
MAEHKTFVLPVADDDQSFFVNESGSELDRELAQRLSAMDQAPHSSSECLQSVSGVFRESAIWMGLGAVIWIAVILATR